MSERDVLRDQMAAALKMCRDAFGVMEEIRETLEVEAGTAEEAEGFLAMCLRERDPFLKDVSEASRERLLRLVVLSKFIGVAIDAVDAKELASKLASYEPNRAEFERVGLHDLLELVDPGYRKREELLKKTKEMLAKLESLGVEVKR